MLPWGLSASIPERDDVFKIYLCGGVIVKIIVAGPLVCRMLFHGGKEGINGMIKIAKEVTKKILWKLRLCGRAGER